MSKMAQEEICWCSEVSAKFPELIVCIGTLSNINVEKENDKLASLKGAVYAEVRATYDVEKLKDDLTVRAYRDFYWKLGIDPTKTRPSGEALLRRVLHGSELPSISTVVDAYNLASMKTVVPMSGFDRDRLTPPFQVRFAKPNEVFTGIGMSKPMLLTDKTLLLTDADRILCIYPYRDSDYAKITMQTRQALVVGYGAPAITEQQLRDAVDTALSCIKQVTGAQTGTVKVFSSTRK